MRVPEFVGFALCLAFILPIPTVAVGGSKETKVTQSEFLERIEQSKVSIVLFKLNNNLRKLMLQVRKTNPFDPPLKPKENDPPSLWRLMRDLVYTIDKVGEAEARYEASRGLAEQTYSGPTFGDWEKKQLPDDPFHSYTARLNTLDDLLAVGQPQLLEDKKALKYDEDHSRFEDMKDRLVEIVNESMVKIPAHVWEPQLSFKKAEADRELSIIDAIKELAKALNDWDPTTRPEQKSDFGTLLRWIFDGLDNFKPRRNRQEAFNAIKQGLQEMAEKLN